MDRSQQPQAQPSPFAAPWPDDVTTRYLTKAAEISGLPATVDVRVSGDHASYDCLGCGDNCSVYGEHRTRQLAQAHAETCRALPRPAVPQ